ncbi:LysR family transcriptional regulator [Gordonibacter sp. RACS_AR68]|uniref:LysR family transcriptional regulator n=1 Tax=Gordonibacter sp. RACS_AR68 TaxID=2872005 RepID=UPI0026034B0A|nr:LysR family transcriptional regulator [Gordonibacter sp. RACS_AR68]MDN4469288.1 LysR family transcriptional regulator [Gordonibacter sp. RACS_AR68]
MDINVFREFAEVVLQGSYSAAAKALNLSQPTLSRHVGALEKELNVKLVADILPVRLTPAGDTVLQTALRMDDLYTGMQDELAELRRVAPARIRIHDTPALRPLSARLAAAADGTVRAHPRTIVEYVAPPAGKTPGEAVAEDLCDVAFVQLVKEARPCGAGSVSEDGQDGRVATPDAGAPAFKPPAGVGMAAISRPGSRLVFGLPREAAGLPEAELASLRHETFLLFAHKACKPLRDTFAAACRSRGFRPAVKLLPCSRYEELYLMGHGDGIHLLSEDDLASDDSLAHRLEERMALVPSAAADGLQLSWHALYRDEGPVRDPAQARVAGRRPDAGARPAAAGSGGASHATALACFLELLSEPGACPA